MDDYKLNNLKYKNKAMSILGTTNFFRTIIITTKWILNPDIAIKDAKNLLNKFNRAKKDEDKYPITIAVGFINEFFTRYLLHGKKNIHAIDLNERIDKGIFGRNKIINALIELRRIRILINSKSSRNIIRDQTLKTSSAFGVSKGNVVGYIHNFSNPLENVPDNCIGVFKTSGVKHTVQFLKCKGIIFLNGAITSHGAILARERNIPAIVSPNISIKDGVKVELSGLKGSVKIL